MRFPDVALFLDDDVWFERSGAGDNVPFRVTSWQGLSSVWLPLIFHFAVRRVVPASPFPSASSAFGLHNPITLEQLPELSKWVNTTTADVFCASPEFSGRGSSRAVDGNAYVWIRETDKFVFDATGRASLPASAFDTSKLLPVGMVEC
jgi:hypothetical protein